MSLALGSKFLVAMRSRVAAKSQASCLGEIDSLYFALYAMLKVGFTLIVDWNQKSTMQNILYELMLVKRKAASSRKAL